MQRKQPHNQGKYIKIEYQCQDFKYILNHEMSKDMCAVHYKRKIFLLQVNSRFKLFSPYPFNYREEFKRYIFLLLASELTQGLKL